MTPENKAITLFIIIFAILGLFASYVTNLPAPTKKGEISSVHEQI